LTGTLGLTGRRGTIWITGCSSDGYSPVQAGGTAETAHCGGAGRRAAALKLYGAEVHKIRRVLHQNVEHARANSTGASRGGGDDARRFTTDSGGGGAPREGEPAARCTSAQSSGTRGLLTSRRFH
jgi:hypothetical protein